MHRDNGYVRVRANLFRIGSSRSEKEKPRTKQAQPKNRASDDLLAKHFYFLGCDAEQAQDIDEACRLYKLALSYNPYEVDTLLSIGIIEYRKLNPKEAARYHRRILRVQENHALAHQYLADCLDAMGDLEQAEEHYQKAIQLNPQNFNAYYNYAFTLKKLGRAAEAANQFELYLEHGKNDKENWRQYARNEISRIRCPEPIIFRTQLHLVKH